MQPRCFDFVWPLQGEKRLLGFDSVGDAHGYVVGPLRGEGQSLLAGSRFYSERLAEIERLGCEYNGRYRACVMGESMSRCVSLSAR